MSIASFQQNAHQIFRVRHRSGNTDSLSIRAHQDSEEVVVAQEKWRKIRSELPSQITGRNIGMISIGGVIGTGLFVGKLFTCSAASLRDGGPAGLVIGYIIIGTVVYAVVVSLAEMVAFLPDVGGPVGLADLYVDKALGFAMGWNAWYSWVIIFPAEIAAAAIIASFFVPQGPNYDSHVKNVKDAVTCVLILFAISINFMARYGQCEFYLSTIKILVIISLLIMGIVIDHLLLPTASLVPSGAPTCPTTIFNTTIPKMAIGGKYFQCPGPFVQYRDIPGPKGQFLGLGSVLMQSIFSYCGLEVPGIAGAEVEEAELEIPSVVKRIWLQIFLLYVAGVTIAGLLVPSNHPQLNLQDRNSGVEYVESSPFIIAMQTAGFKHLPHITAAFFFVSAASAATADVYISSRLLYFLARCGHAPQFLAELKWWKNESGLVVPIWAIIVSAFIGPMALMATRSYGINTAFYWLSNLTSAASILSWASMMLTYIRWYMGTKHAENCGTFNKALYKNRHRFQPLLAYYALVACGLILLLQGWVVFNIKGVRRIAVMPGDDPSPVIDSELGPFVILFVASYLPIPMFFLSIFGYKLINQTHFVQVEEMPFSKGNRDIGEP